MDAAWDRCRWYDITLQVVCYEDASVTVTDVLEIRIDQIELCVRHARRAERFGWVAVKGVDT